MEIARINNRSNFLLHEIPVLHPDSLKYLDFWRSEKRKIIEGYWGQDTKDIEEKGMWRFMPPQLYFYVNFCKILHKPEGAAKTAPRKKIRPNLDDIDWDFFYKYMESKGFSGFEKDTKFTCNRDYIEEGKDEYGRKYISTRDYINQLFNEPLGLPLYENEAKNGMLLGSRGIGKSYWLADGCILHGIITDGAIVYDDEAIKNPAQIEMFVGAAIAAKSSDLLSKTTMGMNNLPGAWKEGTDEEIPPPFYKKMAGNLLPNNIKNPWRHEYDKKVGGEWKKSGSGSNVKHGIFTVENPEAAAGGRYVLIVVEEVGLMFNVLKVHGCFAKGTEIRMFDGLIKCVENLESTDTLMGEDGTPRTIKSMHTGLDTMYKIDQLGSDSYIVNSKHKLVLQYHNDKKRHSIIIIEAEEFSSLEKDLPNCIRSKTYGVKPGIIDFKESKDLKLEPYYFGLWIGDGQARNGSIVCHMIEDNLPLSNYVLDYHKRIECKTTYNYTKNNCASLVPSMGLSGRRLGKNYVCKSLEYYNVLNKKEIPLDYIKASIEDRFQLLAGIIDTDGSMVTRDSNLQLFVVTCAGRPNLAKQILFLARSLGFKCSMCTHQKANLNYQLRYQITINGEIWKIPTRLKRKQASERKIYQVATRNKISISKVGIDRYYGFELNESPLFLLSDNTIAHNSNDAAQFIEYKMGSSWYIGTGGNIEKIIESEIMFRDPEGFNMLEFDDIWEGMGKICYFIPATYANRRFKDEEGNTKIKEATDYYLKRREDKKKAKSSSASDLEMMNYPIIPSEMFINKANNKFPIADLKQTLASLLTSDKALAASWKGEFSIEEDGKPKWNNKDVRPIREFPLKKGDNMEGCWEIYQMPIVDNEGNIPNGRYIASLDPIDDDENRDTSRSLQSAWIYDTFLDKIVAEYTSRTKFAKDYYEQLRRGLLFFNSRMLYENQKKGIFAYFEQKNCLWLLEDTPEILRDIDMQKISIVGNRSKGVYATEPIKRWGIDLYAQWLMSQAASKPDGVTNTHTLKSVGLVRESIIYSKDINTDRISSIIILMIYRESKLKYVEKLKKSSQSYDIAKDAFWDKHFKRKEKLYGN